MSNNTAHTHNTQAIHKWQTAESFGYIYADGQCSCWAGKTGQMCEHLARFLAVESDRLATTPACPECGVPMTTTRYGGGKRREVAYICPVGEAEVYRDGNGHYKRVEGAVHQYRRVWREFELSYTAVTEAAIR